MAGARSAGRMPFMSASPLNRRSAALYGAELTQPGYQQRIAESHKFALRVDQARGTNCVSPEKCESSSVGRRTADSTGLFLPAKRPPGIIQWAAAGRFN